MVDDVRWFWSGEYGRDKILREELEGLQYSAAAAQATSSRLSSQLATLQGSIDARLTALSGAFDAYVELGDIREQLAGFPDTSAIRRDVVNAIEALSNGRAVKNVDPRGVDYWLPYAMNAVTAAMGGTPDLQAEKQARGLDRSAELFMVAAVGALGRGELVSDRVASLMIGDGRLNQAQHTLWQAVLAGVYGETLSQLREIMAPSINGPAASQDLVAWMKIRAKSSDPVAALRWLHTTTSSQGQNQFVVTAESAKSKGKSGEVDPRSGLRSIVSGLVAEGIAGERELLERARVLRNRIEKPDAPKGPDRAAPADLDVIDVVLSSYTEATDPAVRSELLRWIAPQLETAIDQVKGESLHLQPAEVTTRIYGEMLHVTAAGPNPDQLARIDQRIRSVEPGSGKRLALWLAVAGGFAILALLVGFGAQQPGWAVLLFIGAVLFGAGGIKLLLSRTDLARQIEAALAAANQEVTAAVDRVKQVEAARVTDSAEINQLVKDLHAKLRAAAAPAKQTSA